MNKYSGLLKKTAQKYIAFMNGLRGKLEYKRKEPQPLPNIFQRLR
jgi:hypothetical protein